MSGLDWTITGGGSLMHKLPFWTQLLFSCCTPTNSAAPGLEAPLGVDLGLPIYNLQGLFHVPMDHWRRRSSLWSEESCKVSGGKCCDNYVTVKCHSWVNKHEIMHFWSSLCFDYMNTICLYLSQSGETEPEYNLRKTNTMYMHWKSSRNIE